LVFWKKVGPFCRKVFLEIGAGRHGGFAGNGALEKRFFFFFSLMLLTPFPKKRLDPEFVPPPPVLEELRFCWFSFSELSRVLGVGPEAGRAPLGRWQIWLWHRLAGGGWGWVFSVPGVEQSSPHQARARTVPAT